MDIRKIAVLGSGRLGRGIAETAASSGFDVLLFSQGAGTHYAPSQIEKSLDKKLAKWGITESEKRVILSKISYTSDLKELANVDLVVEATVEHFYTKQELLRTADHLCKPNVVFITTLTTLSISELARGISRPESLVGLHFIPPVPETPVVELSRGFDTSDEAVAVATRFAKALKKEIVEIAESPGLVNTRALLTLVNEAAYMIDEGVGDAIAVEKIIKQGWGLTQGPLEMADRIGLDNVLHLMNQLREELGERFTPCPLIRRYVRSNRLGVKTGRGFFTYARDNIFETPIEQED